MVWEHVEAQRLEASVVDLRKEADSLTYQNGKLEMLIHQAISLSHLDEVARKQYNMGPVDPSHVIGIQPGKTHD